MGPFWNRHQHLLLTIDQRRGVIARDLESMPVSDGVGGAGLDTEPAKDAAVVVDIVNLGVALATTDSKLIGVFGGFDVNAVGWARRSAEEAGHALLKAVLD